MFARTRYTALMPANRSAAASAQLRIERSPREPRTSTRNAILSAALASFNARGYERAAIHRIAADIGISPGNLNYHFPVKRDILDALTGEFLQAFETLLEWPPSSDASDVATFQVAFFGLMWDHRFFFNAASQLASEDDEFAKIVALVQERAISGTASQIDRQIANRLMRRLTPPTDSLILAENLWASWLFVLRFGPKSAGSEEEMRRAAILRMTIGHISLIQPYSSESFIRDVLREIEARMVQPAIRPDRSSR